MMAEALSNTLKNLSLEENYLLVAAIDFGTTFSGYAFSFKYKPSAISMNKNWGAELGCSSYKTPTCVMTNPDKSFHSFGYTAEHEFSHLDSTDEEVEIGGPNGYNLYRHFKMMLHNQKVDLNSTVVSTSGHITKAIDIFTMALKYLLEHMMEAITKALVSLPTTSDIRWVLTVPAIWSDEAKGFMREAAYRAGLISEKESRQLLIALEPEVASIYSRTLNVNFSENMDEQMIKTFQPGEKILIIDAGGGTVDITAHEILAEDNAKEICPPSGGPWGGIEVDKKFCKLMAKLFGSDVLNHFQKAQPQQWLDYMNAFEKSKKSLKPDGKSSVKVQLPYSFPTELKAKTGQDIQDVLNASRETDISFSNGYVIIKHQKAMGLFSEPVSEIISHVEMLTPKGMLDGLKYIFLVGGFAECKVLQEACQKAFSRLAQVLIPGEAQLAIIKGAVLFGHNPVQIKSRIARYTYGTDSRCIFKTGVHDPAKKITGKDGKARCKDHFSVFLSKGEEVKTGSSKTFTYGLAFQDQKEMHFTIFKTDKERVEYIDEPGVKKLGEAVLSSSSGSLGKRIETKVTFGHTELMIEARDISRGDEFPMQITIDFLSD